MLAFCDFNFVKIVVLVENHFVVPVDQTTFFLTPGDWRKILEMNFVHTREQSDSSDIFKLHHDRGVVMQFPHLSSIRTEHTEKNQI